MIHREKLIDVPDLAAKMGEMQKIEVKKMNYFLQNQNLQKPTMSKGENKEDYICNFVKKLTNGFMKI